MARPSWTASIRTLLLASAQIALILATIPSLQLVARASESAATGTLVKANTLLPSARRYRVPGPQVAAPVCASPHVTYFGGPLLQNPIAIPVFWNSNVNASLRANISQFYADLTRSSYWSWLQEYNSVGLTPGSDQAILAGTSTAGVVITPVQCPASVTGACNVTDAQIQTELVRQISLGTLPAPTLDCTGNSATVYMVDFPPNVRVSGPNGSGNSCVSA